MLSESGRGFFSFVSACLRLLLSKSLSCSAVFWCASSLLATSKGEAASLVLVCFNLSGVKPSTPFKTPSCTFSAFKSSALGRMFFSDTSVFLRSCSLTSSSLSDPSILGSSSTLGQSPDILVKFQWFKCKDGGTFSSDGPGDSMRSTSLTNRRLRSHTGQMQTMLYSVYFTQLFCCFRRESDDCD